MKSCWQSDRGIGWKVKEIEEDGKVDGHLTMAETKGLMH